MQRAHGYDFHHRRPLPRDGVMQDFIILKASQGTQHVDTKFHDRAKMYADGGMLVMAYHWFETEAWAKPDDQAQHFLETVEPVKDEIQALFIDVERYQNPHIEGEREDILDFMGELEQEREAGRLGIYTNPGSWLLIDGDMSPFKKYMLWQAQWQVSSPRVAVPWSTWTFWQYKVDKVAGQLFDHNFYNGTKEQLYAQFDFGDVPEPPPDEDEPTAKELIGRAQFLLEQAKGML